VKGDLVDIFLAYAEYAIRIEFWGDEVEKISSIDPIDNHVLETFETIKIYPANIFVTDPATTFQAIKEIQDDMVVQVESFKREGKIAEAKRLQERVEYDLEMIRELGYCSGIENYSRYFDRREPGSRPFCLLDYFPKDFLMVIDESHVTLPQVRAMYGGDRARKINLVDYGFRLQSAMDNRPLMFGEFETLIKQAIYVSATPADYELEKSEGVVVEQIIRPTGLLDPIIEVRPSLNQIDDLIEEIHVRIEKNERVLVTTLTKRMAEELQRYLDKLSIKSRYIHSEVDTLERVEILRQLRLGVFDVLVGVNLLREGLDLPEVSLVAIIDADKEGFLRSERSLVQTVGRAARNVNGRVIMYADKMTDSMQRTIDETNRRREIQHRYNEERGLTPQALNKPTESIMRATGVLDYEKAPAKPYPNETEVMVAAEAESMYFTEEKIDENIATIKAQMEAAAKDMNFIEAARLRDEMFAWQAKKTEQKGKVK
jgi:excinuclease ABC subunit B